MTKRAIIYARVSTDEQTTENQIQELTAIAKKRDWEVLQVITDDGLSGMKGRVARPGMDATLHLVERGKVDVVMVWAIDRLGRRTRDLLEYVELLEKNNCDLFILQQDIDTTRPVGKLVFTIFGAIAEFERSLIIERTLAGLARARAQGKRLGRPVVRENEEMLERIESLKSEGLSVRSLTALLNDEGWAVGKSTVADILRQVG